jgi:hypothetical protein
VASSIEFSVKYYFLKITNFQPPHLPSSARVVLWLLLWLLDLLLLCQLALSVAALLSIALKVSKDSKNDTGVPNKKNRKNF